MCTNYYFLQKSNKFISLWKQSVLMFHFSHCDQYVLHMKVKFQEKSNVCFISSSMKVKTEKKKTSLAYSNTDTWFAVSVKALKVISRLLESLILYISCFLSYQWCRLSKFKYVNDHMHCMFCPKLRSCFCVIYRIYSNKRRGAY